MEMDGMGGRISRPWARERAREEWHGWVAWMAWAREEEFAG